MKREEQDDLEMKHLYFCQLIAISCLVGTDYCKQGLLGYGFKKGKELVYENMKATALLSDEKMKELFEEMLNGAGLDVSEDTKSQLAAAF